MTIQKRQKKGVFCFFRFAAIIALISSLCPNAGWARNASVTGALSPVSELSEPGQSLVTVFAVNYIYEKIKEWAKTTTLTIGLIYELFEKDKDNIRKTLNLADMNVLLSDGKMVLNTASFNLIFFDIDQFPRKKYDVKLTGANIGLYVETHDDAHGLFDQDENAGAAEIPAAGNEPSNSDRDKNPAGSPKVLFEDMISDSKKLEAYINNGEIYKIIPEWEEWEAMYNDKNYRELHPLSPKEHLLTAFRRMESDYFTNIISEYNFTPKDLALLRRALFLHDFGEIAILKKDPLYRNHTKHPQESEIMSEEILLRIGYGLNEIQDDLLLIRHHSTLADFARYGESDINPADFVESLNSVNNLRLLHVLQLIDAASVRENFDNSLSMGLERRINEIKSLIEPILSATERGRPVPPKKLIHYLNDIKRQNREINNAFNKLKKSLKKNKIKINAKLLDMAYRTMNRSHKGQMRKDGRTPYVIHPIETAIILIEELDIKDPNLIIAALLHDVLEDTRTTREALEQFFNKEIASIVSLLSKPQENLYSNREERDMDYLHRLIYGTDEIKDRRILTAAQNIKFADRIHSLRTLETTIPSFAKRIIDGTYEIFIPYFVGETEVPLNTKRRLIEELIKSGEKRKILPHGHIETLRNLSRSIVGFKLPGKTSKWDPYTFIRGLIRRLKDKNPGRPVVLAFDGMSGAGKSAVAGIIKEQLEVEDKNIVIFDARDYLISRSIRDRVFDEVIKSDESYFEQREKLFDFKRFKKEILDRIKNFGESNSAETTFTLSNLYNPDTGGLDAGKTYTINRNTVIFIEGSHVLQREFLPYYDATILVYSTSEVSLNNVLERERQKNPEHRQDENKIKSRFNLMDWPSYKKHWFEYWFGSGFIIDNTNPKKIILRRNYLVSDTKKAPFVPEEYIDARPKAGCSAPSADASKHSQVSAGSGQSPIFNSIIASLTAFSRQASAESPFTKQQAKEDIVRALKKCADDPNENKLTKAIAWHLLYELRAREEFKGKIVYSLKTFLDSNLNDGNHATRLKDFVEHSKDRVVFYVEKGFLPPDDYKFLENHIITKEKIGNLIKTGELIVFMLAEEERKQLGIENLNFGQLTNNQVVIPITAKSKRTIENDILLGLEIIRDEGDISKLPSAFRMLLIETISAYLEERGIKPTDKRIREILKIDISASPADFTKDVNESASRVKEIIQSA